MKIKSFEELLEGLESQEEIRTESLEPVETDLNGVKISEYEVGERIGAFLNGVRLTENRVRKAINNISFQLNRKMLKGCQTEELIQFYNKRIGGFLDDFIN